KSRLDTWEALMKASHKDGGAWCYSKLDEGSSGRPLLHMALEPPDDPLPGEERFSAPTSMRDVEPTTHLWLAQPGKKRAGEDKP
ncbi:MAG: hypothetical protein KC416_14940, partial [Myxococcales bacterium]|nr:hypothetical protein [Myxococcales bacterium]